MYTKTNCSVRRNKYSKMDYNYCKISPFISTFVFSLLFVSSVCSLVQSVHFNNNTKQNFRPSDESNKLKYIRAYLEKINKPAVKTIQSPDGDVIDCVSSHLQPAFDHPLLKGQKPLMEPSDQMPIGRNTENFQVWSMSGESCPENTVPIRRITEQDVLRAKSVRNFGRKIRKLRYAEAVGYVEEAEYYGAKAIINVWAPQVEDPNFEFSLSHIWVGTYGVGYLNTIEAGWQVNPRLYGDSKTRFFIYWTSYDNNSSTGCYDLLCSGFVQTSSKIAIGGTLSLVSSYNGSQYDFDVSVWKDPMDNNWWLKVNTTSLGYWPSALFTHLKEHASMVRFGGEVYNWGLPNESYTSTQMGSGHFAEEGFGKASYVRNLQVMVDSNNGLINVTYLDFTVDAPNCYNASGGWIGKDWGMYLFYGGPGKNKNCP